MRSASDWRTLDAAFEAALDLDGAAREAFVASLDRSVQAALRPLLHDALRDDPLLDHPEVVFSQLRDAPAASVAAGERLGPYVLDALVGEGGMGRVFRAHRADGAFDQTVAVKVVRPTLGLLGPDVPARLRREREVLAALDHVGIARLIDGGETPDGVPYLVTEFVDGAPITEWAEARGLSAEACVRLVIDVARAVDHAHRRFVVHRDLKPSNVLVAERDGAPRPVVLDFGIAKLLDAADRGAAAVLTQTGRPMLTPAYAAPELFDPTATVTAAADVYGLGALLYELLTGQRPHGDARPSLTTAPTERLALPSAVHPARANALRGDLDTICLKALHPDPTRRYASAAELADDLGRHLEGRPVEARPDSVAYVASRFARRHRTAVAAVLVTLVALVGGLSVALVSLNRERAARTDAERAAARATEAAGLLGSLFGAADPTPGHITTTREALDAGVERVAGVESDALRGYLLGILGRTYVQLEEVGLADSLLTAALAVLDADGSVPPSETAPVRLDLASTQMALGHPERARALAEQVSADMAGRPDDPIATRAVRVLQRANTMLGRHDEALWLATREVERARSHGDRDATARALTDLGDAYVMAERPEPALRALTEARTLCVALYGRDDARTFHAVEVLAEALSGLGRYDEAYALYRQRIAFQRRLQGGNTVNTAYMLASIGRDKLRQRQPRAAEAALDSAVTILRPVVPPDHDDLRDWLGLLATARTRLGGTEPPARADRRVIARAPR